jgi:NADPH2:quinone reductase
MKAIVIAEYGPPDVLTLRDVDDPHPTANQVVIEVKVAGVNFAETMRRSGKIPGFGSGTLPYIAGNEVGGPIVEIGTGVDPALLGRLVVAQPGGTGGYAERAAVDATLLHPVPDGLALPDAVALLAQGRTALGVAKQAGINASDRVLILAAGGGVGSLLIQVARNAGAGTIVGAAHGQAKLDLARQLGADIAIDYGQPNWLAQVREATGGNPIDVIFDGVGGEIGRAAFDLLRDGSGRMIVFGMSSGQPTQVPEDEVARRNVALIGLGSKRDLSFDIPALIAEALKEGAAGRLKPIIGQTYPLAAAADAHRAIESRATVGKTLLIP